MENSQDFKITCMGFSSLPLFSCRMKLEDTLGAIAGIHFKKRGKKRRIHCTSHLIYTLYLRKTEGNQIQKQSSGRDYSLHHFLFAKFHILPTKVLSPWCLWNISHKYLYCYAHLPLCAYFKCADCFSIDKCILLWIYFSVI